MVQRLLDRRQYGETNFRRLCINMQVKSQTRSPALEELVKKNTTHEKLAAATFVCLLAVPSLQLLLFQRTVKAVHQKQKILGLIRSL